MCGRAEVRQTKRLQKAAEKMMPAAHGPPCDFAVFVAVCVSHTHCYLSKKGVRESIQRLGSFLQTEHTSNL